MLAGIMPAPTGQAQDRGAVAAALASPDDPARIRLSFSRIDTFRQCPLRFAYRYVEGLPEPPSPHLSWGSSIHTAIEAMWDDKVDGPPQQQTLLDALYHGWDDAGFRDVDRDEKLRWYRRAQQVLGEFHARHLPGWRPAVATEQWFAMPLGERVELVGSIDHVEPTADGGFGVVDWKTSKRARPRAEVADSLQLAIYCMAAAHLWGRTPDWVALEYVVPGVRVTVPAGELDLDRAEQLIEQTAEEMLAADFPARPGRLCDWCAFRGICPAFDGDGPDVAGEAVVELRRLRRRQQRDAARISELERIVADRLGEEAVEPQG